MRLNVESEREDNDIGPSRPSGDILQARSVVVSAVARAYGVAHRWISSRIGRNIHSPEGEQVLAEEMVDILQIAETELGPIQRALFAHGTYYLEVLALPPPNMDSSITNNQRSDVDETESNQSQLPVGVPVDVDPQAFHFYWNQSEPSLPEPQVEELWEEE